MSSRLFHRAVILAWNATKPKQGAVQWKRKFFFSPSTFTHGGSASKPTAPAPRTPMQQSSSRKHIRRMGILVSGVGVVYALDRHYNASSITRNIKTFWTGAVITVDYKRNFTPEKTEQIPELQERVGQRIFDLLTSNGGLYIKIGQAIGANAETLPGPIQAKFTSLFDDAPQIPYSVVHDVFVKELGRPPSGPDGVFEVFEEQAVASASIAQVHKAKLWPRVGVDGKAEDAGKWVAVKVQKPDVGKQMKWDLAAFRAVMWMLEHWAFDLPVYFMVDFISDHLRQELNFLTEAENSRQTAEFIANEPLLRDKAYVPKVYTEYTTERVMVSEWIDGVRLSDKAGVFRLMGESLPQPKRRTSIEPADNIASDNSVVPSLQPRPISSSSSFQYPSQPLKGGVRSIMQTMAELFSAQMFQWGQVHCDPHPGNVIIRPSPLNPRRAQVVLLDHGLYVRLPEEFQRDWVKLWRAMLVGDFKGVQAVATGWGFGLPDLVASYMLMQPTILRHGRDRQLRRRESGVVKAGENGDEKEKEKEAKPQMTEYEASMVIKAKLQEFLADTDRMPKAIIFLTRNMRMMQANNDSFGSPVNRIKITGYWASKAPTLKTHFASSEHLHEWWQDAVFRVNMLSIDLSIWKTMFVVWMRTLGARLRLARLSAKKEMTKDDRERLVREFIEDSMGIELPDDFLERGGAVTS